MQQRLLGACLVRAVILLKWSRAQARHSCIFAELYTWDRSGCLIYDVWASSPKLWVNQLILPIKGASKEEAHYETSAALAKESGWSESKECLTTGLNQHLV